MLNEIVDINHKKVSDKIKDFIRKKVEEASANGVVIGLSGGLDSTVTCYLAKEAIGPEKVLALIMPNSNLKDSLEDAKDAEMIAKDLRISYKKIDIAPKLEEILKDLPKEKVAAGNLSARLRMSLLYYYANLSNRLVIGTGDKSEFLIGYFTKYGDGGADFLPIADLYKLQVRELAKYLSIPQKIIQKSSSPRLWDEHEAEGEIGLKYEEIDQILYCMIEKNMNTKEIKSKLNLDERRIDKVISMVEKSEHKRRIPEICIL
jgi:NAD+ synthase